MVDFRGPPPRSYGVVRRTLWWWSLQIDAAFGLSVLERWEKYLILTTFSVILATFWLSLIFYYPPHLAYLSRRFSYYLFDDENASFIRISADWFVRELKRVGQVYKIVYASYKDLLKSGFGWNAVLGQPSTTTAAAAAAAAGNTANVEL